MSIMNTVPYEYPEPALEVSTILLEEFLQRIKNIILRGGQEFLIESEELQKATSLRLTQIIGNSQNFLVSGLIQLREELIFCEKVTGQNQEIPRKVLERFYQIFSEYQFNLINGLNTLATKIHQIRSLGESHNQNMGEVYVPEMEDMIKHSLHQLSAKIEDLKTQIKTSEQTYPLPRDKRCYKFW